MNIPGASLTSLQTNGQDALEEKLGRLAKKPGVKASIVLDRSSGAILKTSGDVSALGTVKSRSASTAASFSSEIPVTNEDESQGIQDFAAAIWKYVKSSDHVLEELDTEVRHDQFEVVQPVT